MCSPRGNAAVGYSCLKALCLLVVTFPSRVADALLLTSPAHETRLDQHPLPAMVNPDLPPAPGLPQGKNIGILLRGETFRFIHRDEQGAEHRKPCAEECKAFQLRAITSFIEAFIRPLEHWGNRVEVFFTTMKVLAARYQALHKAGFNGTLSEPGCVLDYLLIDALKANTSRVVNMQFFETTGQADTMLKAVNGFNQQYGGTAEGVRAHFDYVLIVRNDMVWFKSMDVIHEAFHPNFDNVNVISRCEPTAMASNGGQYCVHDTFWMMPASLYPAFVSCIGHDGCFDPATDPKGNGHYCQIPIQAAIAKAGHPGAFGWLEPRQVHVRGNSDVARIIGRMA